MVLRLEGRPVPVVGRARVYVCGITPYDTTHLGHASTFVWGDVAARVLRHAGVDVEVCATSPTSTTSDRKSVV